MNKIKHFFFFVFVFLTFGCEIPDLANKKNFKIAIDEAIEIKNLKKEFMYGMVWLLVDENNNSFSGWVKELHPNNKLKELGYIYKGQKEGLWISWFENEKKKGEIEWHRDRLSGKYMLWHENSNLHVKGQTFEGEMNGEWREYYSNGQMQAQTLTKMGIYESKKVWLADGQTCKSSKVIGGNGVFYEYSEDGQKAYKRTIKNGIEIKLSPTVPM